MKYFVSRQSYWHSGDDVVEIAAGGLDYANADMLVEKYPELGEGKEYDDPREALEAAIKIRDVWTAQIKDDYVRGVVIEPELPQIPRVEAGFTHGMGMPFEEEPTDDELKEWAEKQWESIPKCERCGDPLPDERNRYGHDFSDGYSFCSECCADEDYNRIMSEMAEEEEEMT